MQMLRNMFRKTVTKTLAVVLTGVMVLAGLSHVMEERTVFAEEMTADGKVEEWKDIVDILEEPDGAFDRVAAYCDNDSFDILFVLNEISKWCYFQVYLDVDNNPATGYSTDGGGYEFLLENGFLYVSYAGEWPGTEVDYFGYGASDDGSTYEVSVPYSAINPTSDKIGFQIVLLNDSWESVFKFPDEGSNIAEQKDKVTIVSDQPYISDFELKQDEVKALSPAAMQDGVIAKFSAKGGDGKDYKYSFVTSTKNGPDNKAFKLDGNKLITDKKLLSPGEYKVNIKVKSGVRSEIRSFTVKVSAPDPGSITEDIFTGDLGEWFVVDHTEDADQSGAYQLVSACSQDRFYAMISSANNDLDTRTSLVLDTDASKGFKYLGLDGADYALRQQKLYPVIADNKLGAPVVSVNEDYYTDHVTVSFYLSDIGNPAKVGVHAFALNRNVTIPSAGYAVTKDAFSMSYEKGYVYPKAGFDAFSNPGTGWACWSTISKENAENIAFDYSLAYLPITWANLETSKGKFDWENVEKEYHISYWEGRNINFIIRFVIDTPEPLTGSKKNETYGVKVDKDFINANLSDNGKVTEQTVNKLIAGGNYRLDIPEWLLVELCNDVLSGKIKDAGTFYNWPDADVLGGAGFSPNYDAPSLITYHAACMKAIAEKFDGSAAYIEMGSLGHWGEMHTWPEAESFDEYDFGSGDWPDDATIEKYAKAYTDSFKKTKVGIRSSYGFSRKNNFGMFNDVFGQPEGTESFLVDISKAPDFWKTNYSGGEFASGNVLEWVHNSNIMRTISYLRDSHTSWLGPCSPCDIIKGTAAYSISKGNIDYLQTIMGYRFRVSKFKDVTEAKKGNKITVDLTFVNEGLTPAYNDYTIAVALIPEGSSSLSDNAGLGTASFTSTKLMPGSSMNVSVPVTVDSKASGKYILVVAVVDKDNNPVMNLGMAEKQGEKVYKLCTVEVK